MNYIEIIKLAFDNLISHKFRSILTMIGIIVGISSVVLISSLGAGFQSSILSDAEVVTKNLLEINFDKKYQVSNDKKSVDFLTDYDLENIKKLNGVKNVAPVIQDAGLETKTNKYTLIQGIDKNSKEMFKQVLVKGRNFLDDEYNSYNNSAIISSATAKEVFKNTDPIGKEIAVKSFDGNSIKRYYVIGVWKIKNSKEDGPDLFNKYDIYVPIEKVKYDLGIKNDLYSNFLVEVKNEKNIDRTKKLIKLYLDRRGRKKDIYEVKASSEDVKQVSSILDKLSIFISLIASISIIVGGIGVMNIMLVTIKERVTEIGLRKAIGAKNKDILNQFILETMIICIVGGIIGIVLGYGIAFIIGIFVNVVPILSIKVLIVSLIVSSLTGFVFGLYPAKQASKLSPMEALRKD